MGFWSALLGGSSEEAEEWQPTLTDDELATIQDHEDWRANGGTIDSADWPEHQSQYSALVERGVVLRENEHGEWYWDKEKPEPYEVEGEDTDEDEPEPRRKFLGLF